MNRKDQIRQLIYTSADLATGHVKMAEKIRAEAGLTWGLPAIDAKVLPMRGGDVVLICGRPGHCKTTLLAYHARREAQAILARKRRDDETVVYATWEGTVDAIYAAIVAGQGGYSSSDYYWGRTPLDDVRRNVVRTGTLPVMMIGFSTLRPVGRDVPRLTLDVLFEAIQLIGDEYGRRVTLACLDYLQLIPAATAAERQEQVGAAIVGSKELSVRMDCPFLLGAQASRDVDGYKIKLAEPRDVQWSSQAEQHCDKMFATWMPSRTEALDNRGRAPIIEAEGLRFQIDDLTAWKRLLLLRMNKQRGEEGRHLWGLQLAPELLRLNEMEMRYVDLNPND